MKSAGECIEVGRHGGSENTATCQCGCGKSGCGKDREIGGIGGCTIVQGRWTSPPEEYMEVGGVSLICRHVENDRRGKRV